ncbi:Disease resistance protein [Cinnamomum micranthum f. kanehirae]|uniref:Disease resistance protein n=1 Tax=Cinnamomum micranthum f. kanehirae TaxID=337451 RepID=A0A3S3MIB3_9MAGN|nr:Disease resistance protein [Cinnamomum micranthum f. kanehirae]
MIQVASRKSNGSVGKCCIHDLLRDLSISEARQNNFFTIHNDRGTSSSSTSVRLLALHCNVGGYENRNRSTVTLRSILSFLGHEVDWEKLHSTCGKQLRVVDALDRPSDRDDFPKEVTEFVLLRYLELGLRCGTLPNAICNLKQLRHLCTYGFDIDEHPQLNNLRMLQTLCLTAGHWINDGLGELTNLRKLGIDGDISSYHEALSSSIHKLWNLRSLKLFRGCSIPPFMPFTHHLHLYKMLLEGHIEKPLEIPPNLVKLTLMGYESKQDVISELKKPINVVVIPPRCIRRYCHLGRRMKQEMKRQMGAQTALHMSFWTVVSIVAGGFRAL